MPVRRDHGSDQPAEGGGGERMSPFRCSFIIPSGCVKLAKAENTIVD